MNCIWGLQKAAKESVQKVTFAAQGLMIPLENVYCPTILKKNLLKSLPVLKT